MGNIGLYILDITFPNDQYYLVTCTEFERKSYLTLVFAVLWHQA